MLLALALAGSLQSSAPERQPDDPLHRLVELRFEAGIDAEPVEHTAIFEGTLSVWARSETFDPRLRIEVSGREAPFEDEDSGGGTTAWITLEVKPGDVLAVFVEPQAEAAAGGAAELHLVAAPESEAMRAAAEAAAGEIEDGTFLSWLRERAGHLKKGPSDVPPHCFPCPLGRCSEHLP